MYDGRIALLTTPLGPEALWFIALEGHDQLSHCYRYEVDAGSENPNIDPLDLLGQGVTVAVQSNLEALDQTRFFHGIVDQFRFLGQDADGLFRYRLTLRPRLWQLSKTTDNRIFQDMSAREIVTEVLNENGVTDHKWQERSNLPIREYCVQYGETDLNFVQRLLEHEGVFFYFVFEDGQHTLILTDTLDSLPMAEGCEVLRYESNTTNRFSGSGVITSFNRTDKITTGVHSLNDFDFTKPSADLMTRGEQPRGHIGDSAEHYTYPGNFVEHGRGQDLADIRVEENLSYGQQIGALGTASMITSGHAFTLEQYYRDADNIDYVVERTDYVIWDGFYRARNFARVSENVLDDDGPGHEDAGCRVRFNLLPAGTLYRPARITPKPIMKGPQTAIVVGPSGEEIYTDEFSRVKVQFHWDRLGTGDENTTCFIRVSSVWAGSGWGFIQIPRIGQEVIVDFLEGDPDQPIITGRVYNSEQMPPYSLPGDATRSGWKSNSSPGGGGWNELMFEDKAGEELVYFQAQKDHDELIKNNETRNIGNDWIEDVVRDATQSVGNNRTESVGVDKSTRVGNNRTVAIGVDDTETVGNNRSLTVGVDETIRIGANSSESIGQNHSQTVGSNQEITVALARVDTVGVSEVRTVGTTQTNTIGATRAVSVGTTQSHDIGANDTWRIGAAQSVQVNADQAFEIGQNHSLLVAENSTIAIGKSLSNTVAEDLNEEVGKNIIVKAGDSITFTCGKAKFQMKKDGTLVLEGKDLTIKGSGKINVNATGDITMKGSAINQN